MARIDELKAKIEEASKAYGEANPIMSDKEFDQLVNELKTLDPTYVDTVTYDDHVEGFAGGGFPDMVVDFRLRDGCHILLLLSQNRLESVALLLRKLVSSRKITFTIVLNRLTAVDRECCGCPAVAPREMR